MPSNVPSIANTLRGLGLNRTAIARLAEPGDSLRAPLTPTREALYSDDPVAVAMRLLFCRVRVPKQEATGALGPPLVNHLKAEGILEEDDNAVVSPYHLRLVRDLFLFSDYLSDESASDAVMGAGETTAVLYGASEPRGPIHRALDLGCGAGTLALLLAKYCDHVIGTDINPRATRLAAMNARVNSITNAEFRTGSFWEPLGGSQFDLIVSQPPYYPRLSTPGDLTYLHGGQRGDEVALGIVQGVRRHLAPKGRALIFTSWPADHPPIAPDMQVLELSANRREITGTRQCIDVIQHPGSRVGSDAPWFLQTEVSAECWGNVRATHIDRWFENAAPLSDDAIAQARFTFAEGLHLDHEAAQPILRGDVRALLTIQPLTAEQAAHLTDVQNGAHTVPPPAIREYLRRGWLQVLPSSSGVV